MQSSAPKPFWRSSSGSCSRATSLGVLPALLLLACGNSDSAPPAASDPVVTGVDAEVDPVEADGDGGAQPPSDPPPQGGRRDSGQGELDASTGNPVDGGGAGALDSAAPDARIPAELGAYTSVERLLVADGRSARVHAIDVPTRDRIDTFVLSGSGSIYASADGRYAYILESAQNQVQVVSMGLPEVAEQSSPMLSAPSLLRSSLSGLLPSAFGSSGDQVAILWAGASELQTFDSESVVMAVPTYKANLPSVPGSPDLVVHLGNRVIASERSGSGPSELRVFDAKLARMTQPELSCPDAAGSARSGPTLAIGCSDGVLLWNTTETNATRVRYPSSAGTGRVSKLAANPSVQTFLTTIGAQLCVLSSEFLCVDAPADVIDYAFDASGKRALVLSRDGNLHVFDADGLARRDRVALFTALEPTTPELELPGLAVGRRLVYVSDPSGGYVNIVDTTNGQRVGRLDVPSGFPTRITVFKYDL